jgi:hypothetical protein
MQECRAVAGRWSGMVGVDCLVVGERGNEYLATTNDYYCPALPAVSFQLARLAAEWGFGLLEAGAPMC